MCKVSRIVWFVSILPLILLGCDDYGWINLEFQPNANRKDTGEARLKRIVSADEWVEFFRDQIVAQRERSQGGGSDGGGFFDLMPLPFLMASDQSMDGLADEVDSEAPEAGGGESFTETNIQEIGVDESDVIKTDGEYFYMLVGDELRIIKAYPASELAEAASLELDASGYSTSELYLNGDRIITITEPPYSYTYLNDVEFMLVAAEASANENGAVSETPEQEETNDSSVDIDVGELGLYYQSQKTIVTLIDVSDRTNPVTEAQWNFDGSYVNSRMIEGMLHLVINQYPSIPYDLDPLTLTVEDIAQFIPTYRLILADGTEESGLLVEWSDFYYPVDPDGYSITTVLSLNTNEIAQDFSSLAVMADPGTIYASTEALYLTDTDYDWFYDYRENIDIHKFAFTDDGAEYVASGSVGGRLLNQFSLGEYEDHLRVATTTGNSFSPFGGAGSSRNYVFVLAEEGDQLVVTGSVEGIAPGEQIYSARFIGNKGFLVTFRKVDPLFTLDLSDPANPLLVGELKVPGYSDYIHLLDENHLLTLGKNATEEGWYQGLQLSIFDVSDFSNPQLVVAKEVGVRGTESEANYNHKAFTFYREENLLAIPVDLYEEVYPRQDVWSWGEHVFSGLQVYHVTPEEGINLLGQISTSETTEYGYPSYYGWARGIFIEESVYVVTETGVHAAPISDPGEVSASLELEGSPYVYEDDVFFEVGF